MFTVGLVLLVLVASSCGESGMFFDEIDLTFENPKDEMKNIITAEVDYTAWPENDSEIFGPPENDETTYTDQHIPKEQVGDSTVWRVFLVVAVLLLAVMGALSTVYYLCVWRGGRIHYKPQKDDTI